MDMGALSGALFNVQSVRESNSGAQAFAPIIEMGDPSTYDSLGGSGDERNFEPAPTPKSGGKLVTTNVESNDQTKIESPPKHAEAGASEKPLDQTMSIRIAFTRKTTLRRSTKTTP
jgi:hypothetical protein